MPGSYLDTLALFWYWYCVQVKTVTMSVSLYNHWSGQQVSTSVNKCQQRPCPLLQQHYGLLFWNPKETSTSKKKKKQNAKKIWVSGRKVKWRRWRREPLRSMDNTNMRAISDLDSMEKYQHILVRGNTHILDLPLRLFLLSSSLPNASEHAFLTWYG